MNDKVNASVGLAARDRDALVKLFNVVSDATRRAAAVISGVGPVALRPQQLTINDTHELSRDEMMLMVERIDKAIAGPVCPTTIGRCQECGRRFDPLDEEQEVLGTGLCVWCHDKRDGEK